MRPLTPRYATVALALTLLAPLAARAHGGGHDPLPTWLHDWWLSALLLASALGYGRGAWRLRRAGKHRVLGPARVGAFIAGMLVLVAALLSPLDILAETSFAYHMTQHLLIMLVAPPLLVYAEPVIAWLWCVSPARRRHFGQRWASGRSSLRLVLGVLLKPALVWACASFALWFWHIPAPYAWALQNEAVHALEHASFFLTSLAFFYLLFAPRARSGLSFGAAMVFGVSMGIQNGFLGAILTFATHPFYMLHGAPQTTAAIDALADQQLAGLIMWVPASIVHLGLLALLFAQWMNDAERGQYRAATPVSAAS